MCGERQSGLERPTVPMPCSAAEERGELWDS